MIEIGPFRARIWSIHPPLQKIKTRKTAKRKCSKTKDSESPYKLFRPRSARGPPLMANSFFPASDFGGAKKIHGDDQEGSYILRAIVNTSRRQLPKVQRGTYAPARARCASQRRSPQLKLPPRAPSALLPSALRSASFRGL